MEIAPRFLAPAELRTRSRAATRAFGATHQLRVGPERLRLIKSTRRDPHDGFGRLSSPSCRGDER